MYQVQWSRCLVLVSMSGLCVHVPCIAKCSCTVTMCPWVLSVPKNVIYRLQEPPGEEWSSCTSFLLLAACTFVLWTRFCESLNQVKNIDNWMGRLVRLGWGRNVTVWSTTFVFNNTVAHWCCPSKIISPRGGGGITKNFRKPFLRLSPPLPYHYGLSRCT
jgi:hypothetical protein